jgi:hypothetical protein
MAFVRKRGTTTALIEAYRDEAGRPRQRVLANLHGEPDTLSALAKLAARREALRAELEPLRQYKADASEFYAVFKAQGYQGTPSELDKVRCAKWLVTRITKIEADLAVIHKDGVAIKKHCNASPDEIQAAIRTFKAKLHDAECLKLGMEFALTERSSKLRRLSR